MTRDDNIKQYENWTGAKFVQMQPDGTFQAVELSPEARELRIQELGLKYVEDIKHALRLGADDIQCSCADKEVLEWVRGQFTEEDWGKVNLSFWGVPQPKETKKAR